MLDSVMDVAKIVSQQTRHLRGRPEPEPGERGSGIYLPEELIGYTVASIEVAARGARASGGENIADGLTETTYERYDPCSDVWLLWRRSSWMDDRMEERRQLSRPSSNVCCRNGAEFLSLRTRILYSFVTRSPCSSRRPPLLQRCSGMFLFCVITRAWRAPSSGWSMCSTRHGLPTPFNSRRAVTRICLATCGCSLCLSSACV